MKKQYNNSHASDAGLARLKAIVLPETIDYQYKIADRIVKKEDDNNKLLEKYSEHYI